MNSRELIDEIDKAYAALEPERLESRFLKLAEKVRAENGEDSAEYGIMLNEFGSYERGQHRFISAEEHLNRALQIIKNTAGIYSKEYATVLTNIAGVHSMMGKVELAEREYFQCIDIYSGTVGERDLLYAAAFNNLALLYISQNDIENASFYLNKSACVLQNIPEATGEYATSLINLGCLMMKQKKYEYAEKYLREAKRIYDSVAAVYNQHYHMLLNNLGIVCYCRDKKDEAIEILKEAAICAEKVFGKEHNEYKKIRNHILVISGG